MSSTSARLREVMTTRVEAPEVAPAPAGLRWLFASTAAAVTGQGMLTAAAPLLAASLTRDPVPVALVAAATWLPWLVVGLVSGALVDRWDTRRVMVATDLARAVLMVTFGALVLTGHASVWLLAAAALAVGLGSCFFDPASQSEILSLVGRDRLLLARANGTFWAIDTLARSLIGPTVGVLLFAAARGLPFLAQGVLLGVSGLLLLGLPRRAVRAAGQGGPILGEIREGLRTLVASDVLRRNAVSMALYNVAYNVAFATLILVLQDRLHIGSITFGVLLASGAVGGIAGGWIARHLTWSATGAYALGFLVQAVAWVLVLVAPSTWVAGVGFVLVGCVSTLVSAVGGAASQAVTPAGMVARVTSVTRVVGLGAAAVGSALSGLIAAAGGLSAPILVASAFLALSGAWAYLRR